MSIAADIADAVVAVLNGADLSMPFEAERKFQVEDVTLEDLKVLRVEAYPGPFISALKTRGGGTHDEYPIVIGIQKKLDNVTGNAEIDACLDLVEEIHDLFRGQGALEGYSSARWTRTEFTVPYSPEDLREKHAFSSVLTLTFEVFR